MGLKIWLVRFQLWFLCFTSVNSRQVERGFAEAGEITVSTSQRKIGKVVYSDDFGELGFLWRKTMVHAFSREDEQDEEWMKNARRRISEENKDSHKVNARFEDQVNNKVEKTRLKSKSSRNSDKKPIVYARNTREKEEDEGEIEEEKLMEEAEKVAKLMRNDYKEISHSKAPVHNHQPRHFQETSKP